MSRFLALAALCLLAILPGACDKVPLLAPTGSVVVLTINSTTVPVNGTAQITAVVTESAGTAPQNGTVVGFTTTLGHIEPAEARTQNGRATATFVAGDRSGTASVRAFSGEAEAEAVDVLVGGAGASAVALRADTSSSDGTTTTIVATVVDENGNPVGGAPVAFTASAGQISPGLVVTDGNGEARTTLATSVESTVTATVGDATADITVPAPGALTIEVSTTTPEVGVRTDFTVAPSNGAFFSSVVVDFGDGSPPQDLGAVSASRAVSHTYTHLGSFTVTATAKTATGVTTVSSLPVFVSDRAPVGVVLTASPNPVSLGLSGGNVTFTATATVPGGGGASVVSAHWSFGDGQSVDTTGISTGHRYGAPGNYTATVRVTSSDGREGTASVNVTVSP